MKLGRAGLGLIVGALLLAPQTATAGPALVFEPFNGTVFYAEDPDAPWFPASLTKLMTAYVAFQAIRNGEVKPDTQLICSKKATEQAPSKLWLKEGESITLETGLKVLIVKSANDVALMIAEAVAGSEEAFIQRMNDAAKRLNMTRSHFANPHGLPNDHQVSTARDLAKLARAIIIEFPEHADLFTAIQIQVGQKMLRTHNGLLGEPSVASRRVRATDLLENGFKRYFWKSLFGTSLDGLAIQASLSDGPVHLREVICGPKPSATQKPVRKKRVTRKRSRANLELDVDSAVANRSGARKPASSRGVN